MDSEVLAVNDATDLVFIGGRLFERSSFRGILLVSEVAASHA